MSTALQTQQTAIAPQDRQLDAIKRIAAQQTPQKEIRTRKGRGGQVFKYTDGAYVIRTLNEAFGHDWDFEADNEEVIDFLGQPFEVRCRGRLTVRLNGQAVTKVQYGSQAIEFIKDREGNIVAPVTIGDCFKGAATDAMKKCASLLGIALDLYDSDYRADKYADVEPEPKPAQQQERPVRLEGAQPQPQSIGPKTQEILKWMGELNWSGDDLADYILMQFPEVKDAPTNALKAIGQLDGGQKYKLHQMIKAELAARAQTNNR